MVSTMETLTIRTENKFRTLVTKQAYKKGEVICSMPSENIVDKPTRFTVQIAKDKHTHVGKLAALNHSCDPNVILDTENMVMIARRDIEKGEELSFFYPVHRMGNAGSVHLPVRINELHSCGCWCALPAALHAGDTLSQQAYPRDDDRNAQQHRTAFEEIAGSIKTKKLRGLRDLGDFIVIYNFRCNAKSVYAFSQGFPKPVII